MYDKGALLKLYLLRSVQLIIVHGLSGVKHRTLRFFNLLSSGDHNSLEYQIIRFRILGNLNHFLVPLLIRLQQLLLFLVLWDGNRRLRIYQQSLPGLASKLRVGALIAQEYRFIIVGAIFLRLADKVVIQSLKFTFDLDLIIFVAQEVLHSRVISHFVLSTRINTRQHIQLLSVVNVGLAQVHLLRLHFLARLWSGLGKHTATATPDANR